jgi:restriction system protein
MTDVPSAREFYWPLLRALANAGEPLARGEAATRAADILDLTEAQREVRIPSGNHRTFRHRCGWVTNSLKHAGLVHSPSSGLWTVTPEGAAFVDAHPNGLSDDDIAEIRRRARAKMRAASDEDAEDTPTALENEATDDAISPEEQIEQALEKVREAVAADLLHRLGAADPSFFERAVLDVLHAMGYGKSRRDLQQVGGSSDGGIDGIISLDRLGLEKVYVQAKRWQSNVGRPEIQGFFGALSGRRASKGVFITTSGFTREAREFASSVDHALVLINGRELANLMIEYGVGVNRRPEYIPEVDSDFFVED